MRIADVRTHVLEAPLSEPFHWSFNGTSVRAACIVEIVAEAIEQQAESTRVESGS